MTKRNFLLSTAAGKLGDMVFYRTGGEQRTRTRVIPKNPKTIAQMTNRLTMLNQTSIFRSLKPIIESSFPSRKSNQSAYNAFVSANKVMNPYYIRKQDLEAGLCVPFGSVIAKGNMGLNLQPNVVDFQADPDEAPTFFYAIDCLFNMTDLQYTYEGSTLDGMNTVVVSGADLYKFIKDNAKVALPNEFTLTMVQGVPQVNTANEDRNIWDLAYQILTFADGNVTAKTFGCAGNELKPSLRLQAEEDAASGVLKVTHVVIDDIFLTQNDIAYSPFAIVLAFKDANGLQVSSSIMSKQYKSINSSSIRHDANTYLVGRFYYDVVMSEYGYTQGSVLEANVPVDTSADEPTEDSSSNEEE